MGRTIKKSCIILLGPSVLCAPCIALATKPFMREIKLCIENMENGYSQWKDNGDNDVAAHNDPLYPPPHEQNSLPHSLASEYSSVIYGYANDSSFFASPPPHNNEAYNIIPAESEFHNLNESSLLHQVLELGENANESSLLHQVLELGEGEQHISEDGDSSS